MSKVSEVAGNENTVLNRQSTHTDPACMCLESSPPWYPNIKLYIYIYICFRKLGSSKLSLNGLSARDHRYILRRPPLQTARLKTCSESRSMQCSKHARCCAVVASPAPSTEIVKGTEASLETDMPEGKHTSHAISSGLPAPASNASV